MEFDGAFCKTFKLLLYRFFFIFSQNVEIGRENDPSKELNPRKAIAMAICPIVVHFIT